MGEQARTVTQSSPAATATQAEDTPFWKEWTECRATIGRLDSILVDLRKFGFSLVTVLLTAGAFFGSSPSSADARVDATLVSMVLIAALFSVDTYYEALKSGAVERALDLESTTNPHISITKHINCNAMKSKVVYVALLLYSVLLGMAALLGMLAAGSRKSSRATTAVAVLAISLLTYMIAYWIYVAVKTHFLRMKPTRVWR